MTPLEIIRRAVNGLVAEGRDHEPGCYCGTADDGETACCWVREARAYLTRKGEPSS